MAIDGDGPRGADRSGWLGSTERHWLAGRMSVGQPVEVVRTRPERCFPSTEQDLALGNGRRIASRKRSSEDQLLNRSRSVEARHNHDEEEQSR